MGEGREEKRGKRRALYLIRRGKRYYEISILGDFFSIYVGVSFLEQEGNEWLDDVEECNVERNILLFSLFLFLSLTISFKRIELKWKYPVYNCKGTTENSRGNDSAIWGRKHGWCRDIVGMNNFWSDASGNGISCNELWVEYIQRCFVFKGNRVITRTSN